MASRLLNVQNVLNANNEVITDYDCYVDGLYEMMREYENLDELNYLASKLEELDDHDYEHFQAAMQVSDYTGSVKDLINLIDNLDKYEIYPGVEDYSDLGHYYIDEVGVMEIPEHLANYIDYEAYGRDVAIDEMGQFTNYGYVRDTQESFTEYYDGDRESIPDEYRVFGTAEKSEEKTSVLKDLKEKQVLCQQHITERIQLESMEPVMESETDHQSVIRRIAVRSVRIG